MVGGLRGSGERNGKEKTAGGGSRDGTACGVVKGNGVVNGVETESLWLHQRRVDKEGSAIRPIQVLSMLLTAEFRPNLV